MAFLVVLNSASGRAQRSHRVCHLTAVANPASPGLAAQDHAPGLRARASMADEDGEYGGG